MDGESDIGGVSAHLQREHGFCDQFAGVDADHTGTEYAFGFFVEEQLGHAFITAGCQRAAAGRPRKHRLVVGDPLFFCLRFGESHPRHFRIGVGDRRDGACVEGNLVPGDDLGGELSLVGGLVREHWFARHIADTENMRHVGAHLFVDRNEAAFIDGDAGGLGLELASVGTAADRHQRIVEGLSRVGGAFECHL